MFLVSPYFWVAITLILDLAFFLRRVGTRRGRAARRGGLRAGGLRLCGAGALRGGAAEGLRAPAPGPRCSRLEGFWVGPVGRLGGREVGRLLFSLAFGWAVGAGVGGLGGCVHALVLYLFLGGWPGLWRNGPSGRCASEGRRGLAIKACGKARSWQLALSLDAAVAALVVGSDF